jgi:hypothetical protein
MGFSDGSALYESQFNGPLGLALDANGHLLVADQTNGALRQIQIQADRVTTLLTGLNRPVDLALRTDGTLFVLNRGSGDIREYDPFGNLTATYTGLNAPAALTVDANGILFVAESRGAIKRVNANGAVTTVAELGSELNGIAPWMAGLLAVSDTGRNAIRVVNPADGTSVVLAGSATGEAGFSNGASSLARFNRPHGLALAPSGALVVADRDNHRVRLVATNGVTTTLYGVNPTNWLNEPDFPGWRDGSAEEAEAREPVGVAVAQNGTVYATENYYHIVRQIAGANLGPPTVVGPDGTNVVTNIVVVASPLFSPTSGYFPMGQTITVRSGVQDVYYTLDGTDPTTNALRVALTNGLGAILWRESDRDLTALRLRAFSGTNASLTVGGLPAQTNEIGICASLDGGEFAAGIGSTVVLPVIVNLKPEQEVRTIQFRVEVTPQGNAPLISDDFRVLSISPGDFVPVASPAESGNTATISSFDYRVGQATGLGVSAIGTNANFLARKYAVVAMLALPIPAAAIEGNRYTLKVLEASATSDAQQTPVPFAVLPERRIVVTNLAYTVGDSARGWWYNSGLFGDGNLDNSDVNNAFYAAMGVRAPYPFTDVFDAMDAFPPDIPGLAGGDGQVRYLDWQVILRRALRLDTNNWQRRRGPGGIRNTVPGELMRSAPASGTALLASTSGTGWSRPAHLSASSVSRAEPGADVTVPVSLKVAPGAQVAGLMFRAAVVPLNTTPALQEPIRFEPALGVSAPSQSLVTTDGVGCGWNLGALGAPLQGQVTLGQLRLRLPPNVRAGDRYSIRFSRADGAPDLTQQYEFETTRAHVWVGIDAAEIPDVTSDEWKAAFFGDAELAEAAPDADPDGDGSPNAIEYLAGTHPGDAQSRLELQVERRFDGALVLRWQTAPGRGYVIEQCTDLALGQWSTVADGWVGEGQVAQYVNPAPSAGVAGFYRLRLKL